MYNYVPLTFGLRYDLLDITLRFKVCVLSLFLFRSSEGFVCTFGIIQVAFVY